MRKFGDVIGDIAGVLHEAAFLNALLNTCLVFMVLYFIFTLINLFPLIMAFLFSLLYLIMIWVKKTEKYTARLVEKRFPFLRDKLTTARDSMREDNFVINNLRMKVTERLSMVDASALFEMKRATIKTSMIVGVIFLLMFVAVVDFRIFDTEKALANLNFDIGGGSSIFAGLGGSGEGKFGDGEGLEFRVPQTVDVTDIQDVEEKKFKKEEFLSYDELNAIGAKEYNDPITEEENEVLKSYFNKINER